jgi:hypothetical protein
LRQDQSLAGKSALKQATVAISSDKGAACNAATGVTFADQTGLALDIAAGATTTFPLRAVSMSNASDNSCQGATFTIPVEVTGASSAAPRTTCPPATGSPR